MFTWLKNLEHLDLEGFLASRQLCFHLKRYVIPGNDTRRALYDLFMMNIHYASLFPDMDGAAKMANGFFFFNEPNNDPNALKPRS